MYSVIKWIDRHTEAIFVFNTFITLCAFAFFTLEYVFPLMSLGVDKFEEPEWTDMFQKFGDVFFTGSFVYLLLVWGRWFEFRQIGRCSLYINSILWLCNSIYIFGNLIPDIWFCCYSLGLFIIFVGITIWNLINNSNHN